MNIEGVESVMAAARSCAMAMMQNADYIQRELPGISMPETLRTQVAELCSELIGTKHDVFTELFELDTIMRSHGVERPEIQPILDRIASWFGQDSAQMNEVVKALQTQAETDSSCMLVALLVSESSTNVLNALNNFLEKMDALG